MAQYKLPTDVAYHCADCPFTSFSTKELQNHLVKSGHKKLGTLRQIFRELGGEWSHPGARHPAQFDRAETAFDAPNSNGEPTPVVPLNEPKPERTNPENAGSILAPVLSPESSRPPEEPAPLAQPDQLILEWDQQSSKSRRGERQPRPHRDRSELETPVRDSPEAVLRETVAEPLNVGAERLIQAVQQNRPPAHESSAVQLTEDAKNLLAQGEAKEASNLLTKAIALDPTYGEAWGVRADAYDQLGRRASASGDRRKARSMETP